MKTLNKNYVTSFKQPRVVALQNEMLNACLINGLAFQSDIMQDDNGVIGMKYSIGYRDGKWPVFTGLVTLAYQRGEDGLANYEMHLKAIRCQIVSELCPPTAVMGPNGVRIACWKRLMITEQNITDTSPSDSAFILQTQAPKASAVWVGYGINNEEVVRIGEGTSNEFPERVAAISQVEVPILGRVAVVSFKDGHELEVKTVTTGKTETKPEKALEALSKFQFDRLTPGDKEDYLGKIKAMIAQKTFTVGDEIFLRAVRQSGIFGSADLSRIQMEWLIVSDFDPKLEQITEATERTKSMAASRMWGDFFSKIETSKSGRMTDAISWYLKIQVTYVRFLLTLKSLSAAQIQFMATSKKECWKLYTNEEKRAIEVLVHKNLTSTSPTAKKAAAKKAVSVRTQDISRDALGSTKPSVKKVSGIDAALGRAIKAVQTGEAKPPVKKSRKFPTKEEIDALQYVADNHKTMSSQASDKCFAQILKMIQNRTEYTEEQIDLIGRVWETNGILPLSVYTSLEQIVKNWKASKKT